eukprot:g745.t1
MARPETALSKSELLAACRCFQTGRRLGNRGYAQGRQLSCGATGEVYFGRAAPDSAAFEILHGGFAQARQVALKHMRSINAGVQRQIQQEISTVFRCRAKYAEEVQDPQSQGHPNLVAYLDWFAGPNGLDREVYLVMEFCPFSLADMIFVAGEKKSPQCHRFPESEVVKVLCDLLNALNFLNRQGLAHRDVKTENILWAEGCYKLADFGTATMLEAAIPRTNECGTLWIMAPELLGRRPHGLNCDVWSLGDLFTRSSPSANQVSQCHFATSSHLQRGPLRSLIFEDMLREEPELRPIALELWQMLQTSRFETLAQQAEAVEPAAEGNTKEELLRSVCPTNMLRAMNLAPTQGGYLSTAFSSAVYMLLVDEDQPQAVMRKHTE